MRKPSTPVALRHVRSSPARLLQLVLSLWFASSLCGSIMSAQDDRAIYSEAESLIRSHDWDKGLSTLQPLLNVTSPTLRVLNLAGLAYTGKGDLVAANTFYASALKIDSGFVPALKNLAINELALGQTKEAQNHLEDAAKQAPRDSVVNLYLGEISYRHRDFQHAAEYLHNAGDLVTRKPELLASLAVTELNLGNRQRALEMLDRLPPQTLSSKTLTDLGIALAAAGLHAEAIPYLEAALTAFPSSPEIGYDLALCLFSTKQFPQAVTTLEGVAASGHESSENDNLLAEAYEALHRTQDAVDALRRAIALSPNDDDNYLAFASLCIDHQDFANASKILEVGLSARPGSARLLFERGIVNAMQDKFDLAERDFQQAAALAPENNSGTIGLGVTLLETGNAAKAIPILRDRLKSAPNDANLNYLLGEAILRTGAQDGDPGYAEARAALEKAVHFDPSLVEPHISLGTIYLRAGRFEDAVAQLEMAKTLDPKAKAAYSHLAIAYRRLGRSDRSTQVMLELRSLNDREREGPKQLIGKPNTDGTHNETKRIDVR